MHSDRNFLFTYGTLMQGFVNPFAQRLHSLSTWEGHGSFPGILYKLDWYPGAHYIPGFAGRVYGEVYRITDPALLFPELDDYEDVFEDESRSLYIRKQVPVLLQHKAVADCWVYLYNQPVKDLEIIESGSFRPAI